MIKSNILKKIASIAVTASLAIGGSLLGAAPSFATTTPLTGPTITSAPTSATIGETVQIVAEFPGSITVGGDTYELKPANFLFQGSNTYGNVAVNQQACLSGEVPGAVEITQGFQTTCTNNSPAQSSESFTAAVGSGSPANLVVTGSFVMTSNSFYIGDRVQLRTYAEYSGVSGSAVGQNLSAYASAGVAIRAALTGTSISATSHQDANLTFTSDYTANVHAVVRTVSSQPNVSTSADIIASSRTRSATAGQSMTLVLSGLAASTNYAVDFGVIDPTFYNRGVVSEIITLTFSTTAPPASRPGQPGAITLTPGDGQVSLSWTAPSSDGGSAITDYLVEYSANNPGSFAAFSHTASNSTSIVVTGLSNGTAYYFQVTPINSVGTGYYPSTNYTPAIPTAPLVAPSTYTLSLDLQGGSFAQPTTYSNLSGTVTISNVLTAYFPSKQGYTFDGWSLTAGGSSVTTVNMTANKTIYAKWIASPSASTYTLSLDLQGGSFAQPTTYSNLSGTVTISNVLTAYFPSKQGYTFDGWSLTAGGSSVTTVNMTANKTIYAKWAFNNIVVSNAIPVITGSAAVGSTVSVVGVQMGGFWMVCDSAQPAGMAPASCGPFKANASDATWIDGPTLVVTATAYKWTGCNAGVCTTALINLAGKHIGYYNNSRISATLPVGGVVLVVEEVLPLLDSLGRPARTQGKTPAFVKSVVKDIAASLAAIKPIHASANQPTNGGVIKLETESLGTVSKVLIGDTEVKTDLKDGVISFTSPLVKVPTDLTITASIGTLIFDDAIKPIATLKSVLVPVTSGNVKKITDETIQVLNSVLLADSKATNVTCTATASANNGVAKAAARAAALAACGYLTNVAQDMVAEIVVKVDTAARNNKATKLTFEVSK